MALRLRRKSAHTEKKLITLFNALGDATRFRLIQILADREELCVSELAREIGISTAGASQHLKILEHAGLVDRHRFGQKICYQINKQNGENKRLFELILA